MGENPINALHLGFLPFGGANPLGGSGQPGPLLFEYMLPGGNTLRPGGKGPWRADAARCHFAVMGHENCRVI